MNGRIIDYGESVPLGSVVVAEVNTSGPREGLLNGNAQVCTYAEADELDDAGHDTFGTWQAFKSALNAQQSMYPE